MMIFGSLEKMRKDIHTDSDSESDDDEWDK
jgi:hypothetical protein